MCNQVESNFSIKIIPFSFVDKFSPSVRLLFFLDDDGGWLSGVARNVDTLFKISLFKALFYVIFHSLHFFFTRITQHNDRRQHQHKHRCRFSSLFLFSFKFLSPIIAKHFSLSLARVYSSLFSLLQNTINHEREWNLNKKITKQQKKKLTCF
jgi:hypothetical protein